MGYEQYKDILPVLKHRNLSAVLNNARQYSSILISNRNIDYKEKDVNIYPLEYFYYGDKKYSHIYSIDHPENTIGIIKVDSMPYTTFIRKNEKKSFVINMHNIAYQRYCEPFLLFINGKFVNWNYISLIYDYGNSYIILHGEEYNYYALKFAKIDLLILPFKLEYIGEESDQFFDHMYEVYVSYIQNSLTYDAINDKYSITVPGMDTTYEYKNVIYNIGAWLYSELKYNYFNLLSDSRINKMKNMDIVRYEYDISGNIIKTNHMKFNAFDKDSYNKTIYKDICNSSINYENKSLFKFDSYGLLNDEGNNVFIIDHQDLEHAKTEIIFNIPEEENELAYATYKNEETHMLFRQNCLFFKNGLFNPECKMNIYYNIAHITDSKMSTNVNTQIMYVLYNRKINDILCYQNTHALTPESYNNLKNCIDNLDYSNSYITKMPEPFDFKNDINKSYSDNLDSLIDAAVNYDVNILEPIYKPNIKSFIFSGAELNNKIISINSISGIKISRSKYNNHESYIIIFENGELIEEYNNLLIYPNFFFLPINRQFNNNDKIEFLYFNKINNTEITFKMTNSIVTNLENDPLIYQEIETDIFDQFIDKSELKIFNKYPEDLLVYKDLIIDDDEISEDVENISFNVSKNEDGQVYINSCITYGTELTAVSSRKFIYQRLNITQPTYKLKLGGRFKYCDNQKQYILFINGRRMSDDSFLITIPKHTRPFNAMWIYMGKYINPGDRVDVFYVPEELVDINYDNSSELTESGYIITDKTKLDVPYNPNLYLLFINGKKIPYDDMVAIDSHTFRIKNDQFTKDNLIINVICDKNTRISNYMYNDKRWNDCDNFIKNISIEEIDDMYNIHTSITSSSNEANKITTNVGKIALLNEIIRDFWVSTGYNYANSPFLYDYIIEDFYSDITVNNTNFYELSSLTANREENIKKYELLFDYIEVEGYTSAVKSEETKVTGPVFEKGIGTLYNLTIKWDYNLIDYRDTKLLKIYKQYVDVKLNNGNTTRALEDITIIDTNYEYQKEYNYPNELSENSALSILITGISARSLIQKSLKIKFSNAIYYGIINANNDNKYEMNYILDQFTTNKFTKILQDTLEVDIENYDIGNNNYFYFAAPSDLCTTQFNATPSININILNLQNNDNDPLYLSAVPYYTDGSYDVYTTNNLHKKICEIKMVYCAKQIITNKYGYQKEYIIWRSNGYFTNLPDNHLINIKIKNV